jgi:hypothetical protein
MKRFFIPLFIAAALILFTLYRINGFDLCKISGSLAQGAAVSPEPEYRDSLHQPFYYLAKGRQCFVFVSADGQTVIKFLNYNRFSLPKWLDALPCWQKRIAKLKVKRSLRFDATIESFRIAMEYLPEETGILYLHLQEGGHLPKLQIVDRAHRIHHVDLNRTAFVLQKKAIPIFDELESRYQMGGAEALNEGIQSFVSFIKKRSALLVADDDRDVGINFGFHNGHLMLLDPGRLFYDPTLKNPERVEREIKIASKRLRQWLNEHHPDSIAFFDQQISMMISRGRCKICVISAATTTPPRGKQMTIAFFNASD